MNEYKVSIIVGIYNSAKFLRQGLESIKKQTWSNIEVLLMNDGSSDDSGKICDEYSNIDPRFKAIHKENSGVCASRNLGLDIATGDYVCFMDGDDWLAEDFVEYLMSIIIFTGAQMAFSDKLFTTFDRIQVNDNSVSIIKKEDAIKKIIYPYMTLGPWNKMYSMQVIREKNVRFPSHWFGETLHFASLVAYYSSTVAICHRKIYNYRLDNINSGTTQFNVNTRLLSLDNCLKLRKQPFYKEKGIKNAVEWHIYTCYFTLIVNIMGTNSISSHYTEYNNAKKYLKKHWIYVLIHSEVSFKDRLRIMLEAFAPNLYAKRLIMRHLKHVSQLKNIK